MSDEKPSVVTVTGLQMDDPLQPLRVLEYAKPTHRLQFYGDNNVLVATIHPDGRVEFGPGYTTDDDVSRRLWTCFGQLPAKLAEAEKGRDEARAQVTLAQRALGNGGDDEQWRPGETAVAALCRHYEELQFIKAEYEKTNPSELTRDALVLQNALLKADLDMVDSDLQLAVKRLTAENERLTRERDEARADNADLLARLDAAAFAVPQGLRAVAEKQREACGLYLRTKAEEIMDDEGDRERAIALHCAADRVEGTPLVTEKP